MNDMQSELERRISELERTLNDLQEGRSDRTTLAFGQYNPLVTKEAGRIIMEIPYDDSLDGSFPLECFFQMPVATKAIKSAKVWVQRKPFRQYSSAASSSSSPDGIHSHAQAGALAQPTSTDSGHFHTIDKASYPANTNVDSPGHTHTITTTLTAGIFESGPTGTISLQVADDGVNYGSALVAGASTITALLLSGLTKKPGDKRIKITATGLMRVQVLIVLDLRVSVLG